MALTLIATPGADDANAYADVADADAELAYRVGGEAWDAESPDQKIQDLVTGASMIDALILNGEPTSADQSMQFPRDGDTDIPTEVWKANIVLALDIARKRQAGTVDVVNPIVSSTKHARSGDDEVEFFEPTADLRDPYSLAALPLEAQRLLSLWVFLPASLGWGSAVVTRSS